MYTLFVWTLSSVPLFDDIVVFFQGTLRVLLVLLHDFPEFLCDYHYGFCDVIPPNCIQLRNLILSAFPRNMRLPDPFTPNLKVKKSRILCLLSFWLWYCLPKYLLKLNELYVSVDSIQQIGVCLTVCFVSILGAGGHAEWDQHCSPYPHQLHRCYALTVQKGSRLLSEDSITCYFPLWTA